MFLQNFGIYVQNYTLLHTSCSPLALRSMQDPGLLQDQFPNVSSPNYFSSASNMLLRLALRSSVNLSLIQHCPPLYSVLCRCLLPVSNFRSFSTNICFMGWGCESHAQPPTWRNRLSLFVWVITFDLYGTGGLTSSYATAIIALRIIWPHKPHHYVKVRIISGVGGL